MYQEKINYFAGKIIPKCSVDGFEDTLRDLITFDGADRKLQRIAQRGDWQVVDHSGLKAPVVITGEVVVEVEIEGLPKFFCHSTYEFESPTLDFSVIIRISAERSRIFSDIYRRGLEYSNSLDKLRLEFGPNDHDRLELFNQAAADFTTELLSKLPH